VNGGNGAEVFSATANGTRVRFDRITPAPFSVDIGTTENLVLNANGGDDSFSASGNLAALIALTVDGGPGNDTLLGGNGNDRLLGGDGNDFIDGNQGADVVLLGAGDDTFQWDPGDGSDTVEGGDGNDTMQFNGANIAEQMEASANGPRVRFTRDIGNVTMDFAGIETFNVTTRGGADNLVIDDLTGTDLTTVNADLASVPGTGTDDGAADNVTVNGSADNDVTVIAGSGPNAQIAELALTVNVAGAGAGQDRITATGQDGDDVIDASGVTAGSALITLDGGAGNDLLIGGAGDDIINGGDGDDVLIGGPGIDTLNGGAGDDTLIDGEIVTDGLVAAPSWLSTHTSKANGKSVVHVGGRSYTAPAANLAG
jgi:Ca2+-binding RTX toxin-like protein